MCTSQSVAHARSKLGRGRENKAVQESNMSLQALHAYPPAEVLDPTGDHEFTEQAEEVVGGNGLVMQLWVLKHVHGCEHRLC